MLVKKPIISRIIIGLFLIMLTCWLPASGTVNATKSFEANMTADSSVSPTVYFINIDPIGNHTVNDVFFINGTTNLPEGVTLNVETVVFHRPRGIYSDFAANTSIRQGNSGVNFWSCNISPVLWWTGWGGDPHDIKHFETGSQYIVVYSYSIAINKMLAYNESNEFTISSADSGPLTGVSQSGGPQVTIRSSSGPTGTGRDHPVPATPKTPISGDIPMVAVILIVIMRSINWKQRE